MDFLLLLSALFTALTGVATGPRAPVSTSQVASVASAATEVVARDRRAAVPVQQIDVAATRLMVAPILRLTVAIIPAFASRRRE